MRNCSFGSFFLSTIRRTGIANNVPAASRGGGNDALAAGH